MTEATLTDCSVFAVSVWGVQLDGAVQDNLVVTLPDEPIVTVDNIKIAQFIHLILNNKEIRYAIDTITTKVVLLLGRFTPKRLAVLHALKIELRQRDYVPVLFDFEKTTNRNVKETVNTLAHLAKFIIVDLTDPNSVPTELQLIIPNLMIPVQPILLQGKRPFSMFVDFPNMYHWVLPLHYYKDQPDLLRSLKDSILQPVEEKAKALIIQKAKELETR